MLGRGIDNNISTLFDCFGKHGRREHIVHHHGRAHGVGNFRDRFDVDDLKRRVRHTFKEHGLGIRTHSCTPFIQIGAIHKSHLNPVAGQDVLENVKTGTKQRLGGDNVIARFQDRRQRTIHSRHAGCRGKGIFGPFQHCNAFFEHRNGRVAVAGINKLILAQFDETLLSLFGSIVDEPLGQENGLAHLIVLAATATTMDQLGAFVPTLAHLSSPRANLVFAHKKTPNRPSEGESLRPDLFSGLFNVARNPVNKSPRSLIRAIRCQWRSVKRQASRTLPNRCDQCARLPPDHHTAALLEGRRKSNEAGKTGEVT